MTQSASTVSSLIELPDTERLALLKEATNEQKSAWLYDWKRWARDEQLPPPGDWSIWLLLSGRGFGKTRAGAEWVREQVKHHERVALVGKDATDMRSVMIEGDSGILRCCPKYDKPDYQPSKRQLVWPNGAISEFRTGEDPEGVRGLQFNRVWCDELCAWQYPAETWAQVTLGMRLGMDVRALITTTPKPIPVLRELVEQIESGSVVVTKGSTYENRENLAPAYFDQVIKPLEGTRLGRQELEAELLLDEGLAYRVINGTHVVPEMAIDNWWHRFEAMDYGTSAPTSWGCFATDYDGNVIAFGLHHEPGFPSDTAPKIHDARVRWWSRNDKGELERAICFAPADIRTRYTKSEVTGKEVSAETEFNDLGIYFAHAQQDRRAGYIRIAEMLKLDPEHVFPDWHPLARTKGAPRFFILDTEEMQPLISALRDAPLEDVDSPLSKLPGEAVEEDWESRIGHAHAMLRYALMSRPRTPAQPTPMIEDLREARVAERLKRIEQREMEDLVDP